MVDFDYRIDDSTLEKCHLKRNVVIMFDAALSFYGHINDAVDTTFKV